MKTLGSALIWTAGGAFFLVVFLIITLGLVCSTPERIFPLTRRLAKTLMRIMGAPVTIKRQPVPRPGRPYLYMGNHQGMFDLFAIPSALPGHAVGVEAAYHFSLPVWGYLSRKWGNIPIQRRNLNAAIESIETARRVLLGGTSIVILPEGHRTRTGALGEFKKGPFHLALAAGVDIVPFAVLGTFHYHRKGEFHLRPGPVTVAFGVPVPFSSFRHGTVDQLLHRVRDEILALAKASHTPID